MIICHLLDLDSTIDKELTFTLKSKAMRPMLLVSHSSSLFRLLGAATRDDHSESGGAQHTLMVMGQACFELGKQSYNF